MEKIKKHRHEKNKGRKGVKAEDTKEIISRR
jgi:hypothetical protein